MDVRAAIREATEAFTVRRVFGEPFTTDGVTVIPAASVSGAAGGGGGQDPGGGGGGGTGLRISARPAGAYVIRGDEVSWRPSIDWTRLVIAAQVLLAVILLVARRTSSNRRAAT